MPGQHQGLANIRVERYRQWLAEQNQKGIMFTGEQRQWLDAIRDHIARSLRIE